MRSAIGALAHPRHDVAAVDEVEEEARRARRGTARRRPGSTSWTDAVARPAAAGSSEYQKCSVWVSSTGTRIWNRCCAVRADAHHVREDQRMTDAPVVVVAAAALEHAPLDDAVAEPIEADLRVPASGSASGADRPRRVRTDARWWPCSHSRWTGSTLFSMIWSQLHGTTARARCRGARPARRGGRSAAGAAPAPGRGTRTRARPARPRGTPHVAPRGDAPWLGLTPASPRRRRRGRTSSRGTGSGCRRRPRRRGAATCRGAGSARRAGRATPAVVRNSTRSSPRSRTARAAPAGHSTLAATGIQ